MLGEIKKQTSSFLQEKYKTVKLVLTDVTPAELLTEEAMNSDPWGPDARTMTRISEASFDVDDYWRIVDILHRRFHAVDAKEWRQSYKALVLLEFLLTHGPEDIGEEFHCDKSVIRELGKIQHIDDSGFNWGACMQKKSERILNLLSDDDLLQQSRSKALKISKEIQGFGNLIISPSSSSSSSPISTPSKKTTSRTSSFGSSSHSSTTSSTNHDELIMNMHDDHQLKQRRPHQPLKDLIDLGPIEEKGVVDDDDEEGCEKKLMELEEVGKGRRSGGDGGRGGGFRSLSDVGRVLKKRFDWQLSLRGGGGL
ncbi:Clathrin interactor EPSIN 1 [Acorus calamus]|uniref:Clathrin interactor EPSIN 1 n=1 Tax=Acorus calamus TaxID=4465 RepID=A0AAV9C690_ACOCL|nr:Clathrin interactor EPSIN 1 [Acorus calamus]